jgi:hypothetical protein
MAGFEEPDRRNQPIAVTRLVNVNVNMRRFEVQRRSARARPTAKVVGLWRGAYGKCDRRVTHRPPMAA